MKKITKNLNKEINWLLKEKYNNKPNKNFKKDIKRLEKGEPLDYIIGFKEFLGCRIDLSKKPLIPRPETEFWTAQVIEQIKQRPTPDSGFRQNDIKILDIFAGSGCIGIAVINNLLLAQRSLGEVGCDFSDIDQKNINQIKINLKNNFVKPSRYNLIKSDIFSSPSFPRRRESTSGFYDFIFANPPYVAKNKIKKIQKSVLKYEPKIALFGGNDGLKIIEKFLKQAKNYLNKNGKIFMEFSPEQKSKIEKLIKKNKYSSFEFYKDQFGRWRWVVVFL